MQSKPKLVSFFNQVFLDIKPKESDSLPESTRPLAAGSASSPRSALDDALALLQTFSETVPDDMRRSILRQALAQQGEGHIDQVLLEATLRKAQLAQNPKTTGLEERLAELNAELDRLWDLRDQRQEESKRLQWALQQQSEQLDQVLALLVGTTPVTPAAENGSGRNPRRLSALATTAQ